MRRSPISDLCLSIQFVPQEFANLQVSREEFLCMKAILLLNTGKRTRHFTVLQGHEALMTICCLAAQ